MQFQISICYAQEEAPCVCVTRPRGQWGHGGGGAAEPNRGGRGAAVAGGRLRGGGGLVASVLLAEVAALP